jgi:hypothetical protein
MMGGGVIRQTAYKNVVLKGLEERGVVFGVNEGVEDVVGLGVMGLVERGRERKELA